MILKSKIEILCVFLSIMKLTSCFIKVRDTELNITVAEFQDAESSFGNEFNPGAMAYLIESYPILACNKTINPPPIYLPNNSHIIFVSLIKRGVCTFEQKIRTAQNAGYHGVIIYNNNSDNYFSIPPSPFPSDIHIPTRMVGLTSGFLLRQYTFTLARQQFIVVFYDNPDFNPTYYIIAFLGFVSLGFLIIGFGFAIKLCRDCVKRRGNRLKKCHLKKIPVKKFVKGEDHYETCAICLDDFADGDKLRILPCNHAYHIKCIDPWLLKQKRNCPVCKSRVRIHGRDEESDDNNSAVTSSETVNISVNEHTPLINSRDCGGSQSYFSNTDNDVNFAPECPKKSTQNCYENPCIETSEVNTPIAESNDIVVIGMSINNDGVNEMHVTPSNDTNHNTHLSEDLTKIV